MIPTPVIDRQSIARIAAGCAIAALAASPAMAQPYFEDSSQRTYELRTQPGIRITQTPAPARRSEGPQAYGEIGLRHARNSPVATTPKIDRPAAPPTKSDMTEIERQRLEQRAEERLRPVLEAAARGAAILGRPGPVYKDGTPLDNTQVRLNTPQSPPNSSSQTRLQAGPLAKLSETERRLLEEQAGQRLRQVLQAAQRGAEALGRTGGRPTTNESHSRDVAANARPTPTPESAPQPLAEEKPATAEQTTASVIASPDAIPEVPAATPQPVLDSAAVARNLMQARLEALRNAANPTDKTTPSPGETTSTAARPGDPAPPAPQPSSGN